jgi:hypothetical protein
LATSPTSTPSPGALCVCLCICVSVSVSISQQKSLGRTLVQYYCCLNFVATKSGTEERERRGGGDGGLFVRTERSLAGFELGTYALGALLDGKSRGKMDGWM